MRKVRIEFKFALLILTLLFSSIGITAQTIFDQDSLIRIQKIKIFLVSNPAPQYIVEIRNNMTISFYNILPENFSKDHPGFKGLFVDSTTISIESSDFIELEKTINGIDLNSINTPKERKSENGIVVEVMGYSPDNYIIETSRQKTKFSNGIYDTDVSVSITTIRNMFEKLEDKYKPKK